MYKSLYIMGKQSTVAPSVKALQEASQLQQRGERREGRDAITCFEQAATKFREALHLGLPTLDQKHEALAGLAETMQQAGAAIVQLSSGLPDDELTPDVEDQARGQAISLYAQAVETYLQIRSEAQHVTSDACVNCANTLCNWAEVLLEVHNQEAAGVLTQQALAAVLAMTGTLGVQTWSSQQQPPVQQQDSVRVSGEQGPQQGAGVVMGPVSALLDCACGLYLMAVAQEEDALTHSNLGDALMTWAQVLWDSHNHVQGSTVTSAALTSYQTACSMSNSSDGDDLPGLLCNWGVGLTSAAQQVQDVSERLELLSQSESRLRAAVGFLRGDAAPLVGLGDALVARAELAQQQQQVSEAAQHYQAALDQGYGAAMRIQRGLPEAMIGIAEAHSGLARLAQGAGDATAAAQHWQEAASHYGSVLRLPHKIGGFAARCETRYNYVCCLTACGRDQEASQLLHQLLACGGVTVKEVSEDADLAGKEWVQQLLTQAVPAQATSTS